VDARNLTIHGREAADQVPYVRVDRVQAEMKVISVLSTTIGLHSLVLEHPLSTSLSIPMAPPTFPRRQRGFPPARDREQLISLSVSRIEVQRGELLWEDQKMPFDFSARDLAAVFELLLAAAAIRSPDTRGKRRHAAFRSTPRLRGGRMLRCSGPRRADISSLTVASGKSEIHFAGRLQDFHNPQLSGDYHGFADLGGLAFPDTAAAVSQGYGAVEAKARGTCGTFHQGTVQAKDIEYSNGKLSIRMAVSAQGSPLLPERFGFPRSATDCREICWSEVTTGRPRSNRRPAPGRRHVIGRVPPESLQRGSLRLQLASLPAASGHANTKLKRTSTGSPRPFRKGERQG